MKAHEYLLKHSQELSEKYPGKFVAIVDDELIAIGDSELEVYRRAKERYPDKEVSIAYLPTEEVVTLLCLHAVFHFPAGSINRNWNSLLPALSHTLNLF